MQHRFTPELGTSNRAGQRPPRAPAPTKVHVGRLVIDFVAFGLPGLFFSIKYTLKMLLTQSRPGDAALRSLCSAPQRMREAVGVWRTRQ